MKALEKRIICNNCDIYDRTSVVELNEPEKDTAEIAKRLEYALQRDYERHLTTCVELPTMYTRVFDVLDNKVTK